MPTNAIVNLKGEPVTPQARQPRERIELLEERPRADWFVRGTDQWGKPAWYLRLGITGLLPRLYGPFSSRRKCLLFLDRAIDELTNVTAELSDRADTYILKRPFAQRMWCRPIIETPELASSFKSHEANQLGQVHAGAFTQGKRLE